MCPLPQKIRKIFFGQLSCKIWAFSGKYHKYHPIKGLGERRKHPFQYFWAMAGPPKHCGARVNFTPFPPSRRACSSHLNIQQWVCVQCFEMSPRWKLNSVVTTLTTTMLHGIQFSCFSGKHHWQHDWIVTRTQYISRSVTVRTVAEQYVTITDGLPTLLYTALMSAAFPHCSMHLTVSCTQCPVTIYGNDGRQHCICLNQTWTVHH